MAQATEAAPFTNGEPSLSSAGSSVDVTAVLRNLKLRRVSCTSVTLPSLASPDTNYDTTQSRSHLPADAQSGGALASTTYADTASDSNGVRGHDSGEAGKAGTDAAGIDSTPPRLQRWHPYATPSAASANGHFSHSANGTPSSVRPSAADGLTHSAGAKPLRTPVGSGAVAASTFLAFPPASPDETSFKSSDAAAHREASVVLVPSMSAPSPSRLAAALAAGMPLGARQQPGPSPPPLKSASSVALLGQHHAHPAALDGGGGAAAAARPPLSAALSQRAFASMAPSSPAVHGSGASTSLFYGPGGGSSGGGGHGTTAVEASFGSGATSPSVRHSGVAATVFAATSAIVAATSAVAAGGGGGSAAAVAAAAAEVARDIADSVSRSPTVPPRPPSQALARVAAAAAAAAMPAPAASDSPSRSGAHGGPDGIRQGPMGGGSPFGAASGVAFGAANGSAHGAAGGGGGNGGASPHSSLTSQRRSSLELQIARLRTNPDSHGGAAATANGHARALHHSASQRERSPEAPTRPFAGAEGATASGVGDGMHPAASAPSPFAATGATPGAPSAAATAAAAAAAAAAAPLTTAVAGGSSAAAASTTPSGPSRSLAAQRAHLLEELQSAHRRELALAEQLGRARAEVLELTAQLARQTEAAASATAAAETEANTVAELRGQLRKARVEAGEEIRRWRSRATSAEEQLQTALTQLACLRSAAAAVAARSSAGGAGSRSSGGGGKSSSGGGAADPRHWRAAAAAMGLRLGPGGDGSPSVASSGPSSPMRGPPSRGSPANRNVTTPPPLRRSLSHQTLGAELAAFGAANPPRALSTSGGAPEGDADYAAAGGGSRSSGGGVVLMGSPPAGSGSPATSGGAADAPTARPPRPPAASQSPSSSAATAAAPDGGGSAAGVSTPASATASYGSSYGSPASQDRSYGFGFGRGGTDSGGGGSGAEEHDATHVAAAKGQGFKVAAAPPGARSNSSGGGSRANASSAGGGSSQGGAGAEASVGGWAWAAASAADACASDGGSGSADGSDGGAAIPTSFSVPPTNLNPLKDAGQPAAKQDGDASDGSPRLTPSASAALPGFLAGGGSPKSARVSMARSSMAATAGLPPEMAALAAVPEGADGTAVLQSTSRSTRSSIASTVGGGSGGAKGEAAAAALLVAEVERLKQAGNRAYRSDQFPLARHCYTCALELLLTPANGAGGASAPGGVASSQTCAVVSSDGGGAECAAAAAVAAARERAAKAAKGGGAAARVPGERRMVSALYCSRAAAHVAMRLYADAVADCCAASAHDETYAKPWKCRAEALASINAFGPAATALERCIQLTAAVAAAATAAAANPGKPAVTATVSVAGGGSVSIGGGTAVSGSGGSGELVEFSDVDSRELPLLRHILQRLQELARAASAPTLPAAAALLAAVSGAALPAAPPVDHYAVLGVPYHASAVDVRAAYRRLALRYHPDKAAAATAASTGAGPGASAPAEAVVAAAGTVFPMVAEAYAVLSDGASRRAYDLRRARVSFSNKRQGAN